MPTMAKAVISGIGPDQPGIVAAIASILEHHGCNIEDTTMTRLAREFAVILVITVPDGLPFSKLQQEFVQLEDTHNMAILIKPIPEHMMPEDHLPNNPYMISVAGKDHTGITYHVSQKLAEMDINITDLNAQIIQGDEGPVYIMMVEVDIPPSIIAVSTVEQELKALAEQIGMEIQLRPLETVAL
ncbi:MAG TPA: ACT domain-containing protein [Oculatellaceae cyanobacterium]|jgi:glycine cleavage system transcriptional repressor